MHSTPGVRLRVNFENIAPELGIQTISHPIPLICLTPHQQLRVTGVPENDCENVIGLVWYESCLWVSHRLPPVVSFIRQIPDFTVLLQTHLRLRFHRCRKANSLMPFVRLVAISWIFAVSQWITWPDVLASVFAVQGKFVSREPFENFIRRPWSPLLDQSGQM
jgi:hypothetical protein